MIGAPLAGAEPQGGVAPNLELLLFGVAGVLTLVTLAIFLFALGRHANRDSDGHTPGHDDDRGAA